MLQVAFNVPLRASLNEMTTDLVAYLHPQPVNLSGAAAISSSKTHLAFYMGQIFNSDVTGAYSTHPTLAAASAPDDFVHAVLSMQLDTPAFDFVYLSVFFRAKREETTPVYHTFNEYMCDEKTMHEVQRDGMKMVCALGWNASPASGLTYAAFIQILIDSIDVMGRLQDDTMYATQYELIVAAYHEGLRVAAASALSFLRGVPSTARGDFGAFIPDSELPALRQLRAVQKVAAANQLTILTLTPLSQRRPVSALDHIERSQAGVKRARVNSGSLPAAAAGGGVGGVLSEAQRALLGAKASSVSWSSTKKSFWFGQSQDYYVCSTIEAMCPGLCAPFAMTTSVGDNALQLCCFGSPCTAWHWSACAAGQHRSHPRGGAQAILPPAAPRAVAAVAEAEGTPLLPRCPLLRLLTRQRAKAARAARVGRAPKASALFGSGEWHGPTHR